MTTHKHACPICRENHEPERGLSFDGLGINSCGMYRERIATFNRNNLDVAKTLGETFANAPSTLAERDRLLSINARLVEALKEIHDNLMCVDAGAFRVVDDAEKIARASLKAAQS